MDGKIVFNGEIELPIKFLCSEFVERWIELVRNQPQDSLILENSSYPTIEYFDSLRRTCDELMGWNWSELPITQHNLNLMHKDLEKLKIGEDMVPGAGHPVHELHRVLHALEMPAPDTGITESLHFKSYHGERIPITDFSIFQTQIDPGHLILDYPYVGRTPLATLKRNDTDNILMTCIPQLDACAGFHIELTSWQMSPGWKTQLSHWLDTSAQDLRDKYGKDIILQSAPFPTVGHITDQKHLSWLAKLIIFETKICF